MKFRPCIDLHGGQVKQIVGSSLKDGEIPQTNFQAEEPPEAFSSRYKEDRLKGGHIIMLGPGNEGAALAAIKAYPGGMQIGGGINLENAEYWIRSGAAQVIVTSWVVNKTGLDLERLGALKEAVGREKLVLDLSCRKTDKGYRVAADRWQTITPVEVSAHTLKDFSQYCCEYLVHAVDVEGKQSGIDHELLTILKDSPIPVVYAGGISSMDDISAIEKAGGGKIDFTVGSALDLFGGNGLAYKELLQFS